LRSSRVLCRAHNPKKKATALPGQSRA
jgi:hypothetical protein